MECLSGYSNESDWASAKQTNKQMQYKYPGQHFSRTAHGPGD